MDYVLVFPLILAFLSTGQSFAKAEPTFCYDICPAGYYKYPGTDCGNGTHRCEKCKTNTFTEKENAIKKCLKCNSCGNNEVEISPCSFTSNVVCDCKEGFYYEYTEGEKECRKCDCKNCVHNGDYNMKCQEIFQRNECLKDPECATSTPTSIDSATTTATSKVVPMAHNGSLASVNQLLYIVGVVVTFLVLFCLLFFAKNLLRECKQRPGFTCRRPQTQRYRRGKYCT